MNRILGILLCIIITFSAEGQIGFPFIKNFSPEDYLAPGQVWDIDQSIDGVMWFAGNYGVYFFDGNKWEKYNFNISNGLNIRALEISGDTIFIGSIGDFGYLLSQGGNFIYHSLIKKLDSAYRYSFTNIWTVASAGRYALFQGDTVIFIYDNHEDTVKPLVQGERYLFLNKINQKIFFSSSKYIYEYDPHKNKLTKISNDGTIKLHFLPYNDSLLMVIEKNRIKFWNLKNNSIFNDKRFEKLNNLLKNTFIYSATYIFEKDWFAIGTVEHGLFIIHRDGKILYHIDKQQGLVSHTVLKLFVDKQLNLWVATNNGISVLNLGVPYTIVDYRAGLNGTPYDILILNKDIYATTHLNVYYYSHNKQKFTPIYLPDGTSVMQAFSIDTVRFSDGKLKIIAATARGLVLISKSGAKKITYTSTHEYANIADTIYFTTDYYLKKIVYKNGEFSKPQIVITLPFYLSVIKQPQENRLWLVSDKDRILAYYDVINKEYHFFHTPVKFNNAMYVDSLYLFATEKGLYEFKKVIDSFVPSQFVLNKFLRNKNISEILKYSNSQYIAYSYDNSLSKFYKFKLRNGQISDIDSSVSNIVKIFHRVKFGNKNIWLLTFDKFIRHNLEEEGQVYYYTIEPLITTIAIQGKENIFKYPQPINNYFFTLPYTNKAIIIEYSLPDFLEKTKPEFSYKLVRNGHPSDWSNWSTDNKVQLLSLKEGNYIFYLKARNGLGIETSTVKVSFKIKAPFYNSIMAFVLYLGLIILVITLFFRYKNKILLRQKEELENIVEERTKEILEYKQELLSQEENLINITKILTEKNAEINRLIGQLNIAQQNVIELNQYITETVEYSKIIRKAMFFDRNILNNYFREYFVFSVAKDFISGDFYWVYIKNNNLFIAVGDCIGHGISGVLMTMLAYSLLNNIVCNNVDTPKVLLEELRFDINKIFKEEKNRDIFKIDIGIIAIDLINKNLSFSGINNSALIIKANKKSIELKGEISLKTNEYINLREQKHKIEQGDRIYMFTDGFYNQIGGENNEKYYKKNFYALIEKIYSLPMKEQYNILKKEFEIWRGENAQTDDILILGMKIDLDLLH